MRPQSVVAIILALGVVAILVMAMAKSYYGVDVTSPEQAEIAAYWKEIMIALVVGLLNWMTGTHHPSPASDDKKQSKDDKKSPDDDKEP